MSACLFAAVLFPATICMSVRARWIVAETAACTLQKKLAGKASALGCYNTDADRLIDS